MGASTKTNNTKQDDKGELDSLSKALYSLRRDNDRKDKTAVIKNSILAELGYQDELETFQEVSNTEFERFIIDMVIDCYGKGLKTDIILMSFGLLAGYNYHRILKLSARRNKFLEESNYLQNYEISKTAKRKTISKKRNESLIDQDDITDFNDLSKDGRETCRTNLARKEEELLDELALFLVEQDVKEYFKKDNGDTSPKEKQVLQLPKPSYPQPNYERLIWLELKKSNRKLQPLQGMKETAEKRIEIIKENMDKIAIGVSCFVLIFALSMLVLRQTSVETSTDDPLTPYNIKVARPIESYRKDDYSKTEHESKSMQNVKNNNNEDTVKVAKVSN